MYQEDHETRRGPIYPNNLSKFSFRGPFQSKHTKTIHIPTMVDHKLEHGKHIRDQEQPRNDKQKYPFTYEDEEEVEIHPKHLEKCHKDKHFQKVMETFLNEEKDKYFLKLAQEGSKLPHHFNVETIITPKEDSKTSKLQKQLKIMQDQLAQMMHDKEKLMKAYTLDALCPFLFDKRIEMPPFLRGVELPKYDKYFGTTNTQDHLQEFSALFMEFMHNQT